jgi:hypothetical protein
MMSIQTFKEATVIVVNGTSQNQIKRSLDAVLDDLNARLDSLEPDKHEFEIARVLAIRSDIHSLSLALS